MARTFGQALKQLLSGEQKLVTPRIDRWLIDNPSGVVLTDEHADILKMLVTSDANSQRLARFGASSRGTCVRKQVFGYLGMPHLRKYDSTLQNLFNDGTWRHLRWQMMGLSAGIFTHVEVATTMPQYHVKVSADGLNVDEGWGFELKGARYTGTIATTGEVPRGHNLQIHTMMLAFELDKFAYVVEDKASQDWYEVVVNRDKKVIREVKEELNTLADAVEDEKLPPILEECKRHKGKGDAWRWCQYKDLCIEQGSKYPEPGRWGEWVQNNPAASDVRGTAVQAPRRVRNTSRSRTRSQHNASGSARS